MTYLINATFYNIDALFWAGPTFLCQGIAGTGILWESPISIVEKTCIDYGEIILTHSK